MYFIISSKQQLSNYAPRCPRRTVNPISEAIPYEGKKKKKYSQFIPTVIVLISI